MTCMVSVTAFAQSTTSGQDSVQRLQLEITRFSDSVYAHTTLKEFRDFLYEKVTTKFFSEGTFADLYQYFLNEKWANRNVKPVKK